jgi:hypothetical protein
MIDPEPPIPPLVIIRGERAGDRDNATAVRAVQQAAFPTGLGCEAPQCAPGIRRLDPARSLVADVDGEVVGHSLLTATTLERPDGGGPAERALREPVRVLDVEAPRVRSPADVEFGGPDAATGSSAWCRGSVNPSGQRVSDLVSRSRCCLS